MSTNTVNRAELSDHIPTYSAEQSAASNKMYAEIGSHGAGEGCGHGNSQILKKLSEILQPSKKADLTELGFGQCTIENPYGEDRRQQMEHHAPQSHPELHKAPPTPEAREDMCAKTSLQKLEE
ncbi:MAG: hypothetical protein JST01_10420 [Cyanobacteria bacterium SZAS TMP-1]|nr:hypothetical protein [Cyanobacteria bacterium SZAS TMP-1]